ncbi:MAG: hypothetical protein CSYNP_01132 [Syntrophus sp. SKADARSKE-3]|nr:hypothetical protein [Syntrophus sp. SKADARSKE-3]
MNPLSNIPQRLRRELFIARKIASGLLTYTPFLHRNLLLLREMLAGRPRRQVGLSTVPYCYTVWMRHLIQRCAYASLPFPQTVLEVGPGNSLGVGLAALISGADRYYAMDAVAHMDLSRNFYIFEELLQLFMKKASIPDHDDFPDLGPSLPSHAFPDHLFPHIQAGKALAKDRLDKIRLNLARMINNHCNDMLFYITPDRHGLPQPMRTSVDWILSQFVIEHIDNLQEIYEQFENMLRPGGMMTHHIDFRAHWTAYEWNGYWTYDDRTWRWIRGNRPYFVNRAPLSEHICCLKKAGFEILGISTTEGESTLTREKLAMRFRHLTAEDLQTMTAMITVRKPR